MALAIVDYRGLWIAVCGLLLAFVVGYVVCLVCVSFKLVCCVRVVRRARAVCFFF